MTWPLMKDSTSNCIMSQSFEVKCIITREFDSKINSPVRSLPPQIPDDGTNGTQRYYLRSGFVTDSAMKSMWWADDNGVTRASRNRGSSRTTQRTPIINFRKSTPKLRLVLLQNCRAHTLHKPAKLARGISCATKALARPTYLQRGSHTCPTHWWPWLGKVISCKDWASAQDSLNGRTAGELHCAAVMHSLFHTHSVTSIRKNIVASSLKTAVHLTAAFGGLWHPMVSCLF